MSERKATLGRRIRELRQAEGFTLSGVAEAAGISKSYLSDLENDKATPTVFVAKRIADELYTSIGELLEGLDG